MYQLWMWRVGHRALCTQRAILHIANTIHTLIRVYTILTQYGGQLLSSYLFFVGFGSRTSLAGSSGFFEGVRCLTHGQGRHGFLHRARPGGVHGSVDTSSAMGLIVNRIQQRMAQQVLTQFQEHPDAWTRVPDILERSAFPQAKVCNYS
jgi:hypothetical protein